MENQEIGYVYMITNPKGRIYVGSTLNFIKRIQHYKRYRCKNQTKLYYSLIKYGYENHVIEIVWKGCISEMYKYETLIGWNFDVLEKENMNLRLPKFGDVYSCVSQDTRDKIGISKKNNKNFLGKRHNQETKNKMSLSKRNMSQETKNKMKASKQNISIETRQKMSAWQIGRKMSEESIEKSNKARRIAIIQMDLKENFIKEWDSAKNAGKELNINASAIAGCCKNKLKHAGKFKWKYKI